jgi:hypothetical protein
MQEPEADGSSYRVGFVCEDRMLGLMGAVEIGDLADYCATDFLAMDDGASANAPKLNSLDFASTLDGFRLVQETLH